MAFTIGVPSAPVLRVLSDNSTLVGSCGFHFKEGPVALQSAAIDMTRFSLFSNQDTCLKNVSDGLQLHQALLTTISSEFEQKEKIQALNTDIKDLVLQIHKVGEYFSNL